ncbi:hypothetical protein RMATCC62417_15425 [Rhizopus microsporus]|nr:hypothetical protein RMATCC62417_15425 [Rhizopus microsporus]
MLQQPRKKRVIDWLIYAVLLFLVYMCIHAYNNNNIKPTTTTIEDTVKQDKITTQKAYIRYNQKQPTLTFQQDNGTTYMDFPWYQRSHTRPQFRPNIDLLSTDLSTKDRRILLEKAILQAKKLALRKFPAAEYTTIRGTNLTAAQTAAFREKLACWTMGQWIRDEQNSFRLKHLQEPIYSSYS